MSKYAAVIGDRNVEISADGADDAASQARALLAEYVGGRFAAIRKQGRLMDEAEVTVSASIETLLPDGDVDYDADEIDVEVTVPVPADIFRA